MLRTGELVLQRSGLLLNKAEQEADALKDEFTSTEHLLLAMLETEGEARELLRGRGVTRDATLEALRAVTGKPARDRPEPRGALPVPGEIHAAT